MAKLTSRKANAKRHTAAKVEVSNGELSFARSNDPVTHEPRTYFIAISAKVWMDDDSTERTFQLELTPFEWAKVHSLWQPQGT